MTNSHDFAAALVQFFLLVLNLFSSKEIKRPEGGFASFRLLFKENIFFIF
jgi:hypothetical protein